MIANKVGNSLSYAVDIGAVSFQLDAIADSSKKNKDLDSSQLGATLKFGDNGKVGFAYINHAAPGEPTPVYAEKASITGTAAAATEDGAAGDARAVTGTYKAAVKADPMAHIDSDKSTMLAGQYTVGGMTMHLGYGQRKWDTDSVAAKWQAATTGANPTDAGYGAGLMGGDLLDKKKKTTFFGVTSDLGDTGVWFHLQVRSNKTNMSKVTASYADGYDAAKAVYDALPTSATEGDNND